MKPILFLFLLGAICVYFAHLIWATGSRNMLPFLGVCGVGSFFIFIGVSGLEMKWTGK
jgi:hypothetical protein